MILGRVVGEVWATRKHDALDGRKLLIIEPYLWYAPAHEVGHLVAVDPVGAGVGEDVFYVRAREAALPFLPREVPTDAAIVGIVDHVHTA